MQAAADTPEEQQALDEARQAAWSASRERRAKSGSSYQRTMLSDEQNAIIDSAMPKGMDKALGIGSGWYKSLPGSEVLDKTYDTADEAKAAVSEWAKTIDPDKLKQAASASYAQHQKDWDDSKGNDDFFGIPINVASALMLAPALIATGGAVAGWSTGGAAAAGTAGATTGATGLAGTLGMNAGMGATALNAGALNAGVTAVMGGDLKDVLKAGVTGAALSGVGGWAKEAATPFLGNAGASVASGAAMGATGAALTGGDVMQGLTRGAVAGGVSEVGKFAGDAAKSATADYGKTFSSLAGNAANVATRTALTGGDAGTAAGRFATGLASGTVGGWAKEATGSDTAGNFAGMATGSLISGRTPTRAGLLNSLIQSNFKSAGVKDPMEKV